VARLLFSSFLLPLEITSVLILIAIMGAVVLEKREGKSKRWSFILVSNSQRDTFFSGVLVSA